MAELIIALAVEEDDFECNAADATADDDDDDDDKYNDEWTLVDLCDEDNVFSTRSIDASGIWKTWWYTLCRLR